METRFLLPLTVATAFHAFVFFGVEGQRPIPADPVGDSPKIVSRPAPIPVDLIPPDRDETDSAAPPSKGEPEIVSQPEILSPHSSVFETPLRPQLPLATTIVHRIPSGPIGLPDGIQGGEWRGTSGVFGLDYLDNAPRTRSQVAPIYPSAERNAGITGEVVVEFIVDESGQVMNARVVRSSHAAFEPATLRAVQKWRFEPGKKDGRAVRFRMMVPVKFNLDE